MAAARAAAAVPGCCGRGLWLLLLRVALGIAKTTSALTFSVDDDGEGDDGESGAASDGQNEIVFVAIIASILICGCGCLSSNFCGEPPDSGNLMQDRRLNEPLINREEERRGIFGNSLAAQENEWLCPVCAFENRPRAQGCSLCGCSRKRATRYYDEMRRLQKERRGDGSGSGDDDEGDSRHTGDARLRVTMIAPSGSDCSTLADAFDASAHNTLGRAADEGAAEDSLSRVSTFSPRDGSIIGAPSGLSASERQQAFMVRRFNELTLRQRAAHRRRLWQRRLNPDTGRFEWVRVAVAAAPAPPRGRDGGRADGGGEGFWDGGDVEQGRQHQDSFGDSAHMSSSPGFTSVLDVSSPGTLGWQAVNGVATEAVGPIKQRIIAQAQEPGNAAGRLSTPDIEVQTEHDLEAIAALPFRRKQQWLQTSLDTLREADMPPAVGSAGVVKIKVRRNEVLADSFSQIMSLNPRFLAKRVRIIFQNEPGVDAGGLFREWCLLVTQQLFDPQFGLFIAQGEDSGYTINPISGLCNELHLKYFRFAGRFIGKALLEHQTLPAHFSLPMLKHILSIPISFSDLEFEDADLYQNLLYLREHDGASALDLDFTVTMEHLGVRVTRSLVPGGESREVNDSNKGEYLERRFKFRMLDSISEQLWQLLCGLYEVIPKEALTVFDYQELELLLSGVPEIDMDDWRRHSRYVGLFKAQQQRHPVVKWFWDIVDGFTHEERARLLQFATGTTRLPAQGFKALEANDGNFRRFTLAGVRKKDALYPKAHTCFNRIDLPTYETKKELEGYLTLVINMEITGFSDE